MFLHPVYSFKLHLGVPLLHPVDMSRLLGRQLDLHFDHHDLRVITISNMLLGDEKVVKESPVAIWKVLIETVKLYMLVCLSDCREESSINDIFSYRNNLINENTFDWID